jgi:hypothetical protein
MQQNIQDKLNFSATPAGEAREAGREEAESRLTTRAPERPPETTRPVSRELPVDPTAITAGASHVAFSPLCLYAVATTPAGWRKLFAHSLPRHRPSPSPRRVGTCIMNFETCSAFTHVTACTLAESPLRPSSTGGFSSFVTSTAAAIDTGRNEPVPGWDLYPLWTKRLSRRTRTISVTPFLREHQMEPICASARTIYRKINSQFPGK